MDRYLAIDYGSKRIGLALTDPLKIASFPFEVILNDDKFFIKLAEIIKEKNVSRLVLGYPIKMDGTKGPAVEKVDLFYNMLKEHFGDLPIILQDERLTTAEAEKRLIEADYKRSQRRAVIDRNAAALILEKYLNGAGRSA